MKTAAPPTAATARIPTMMTEAMRTDTQVGSLFELIPGTYESLSGGVHQTPGLFRGAAVVVTFAQGACRRELFAGRRLVAGLQRHPAQLEVRPSMDPLSTL